MPQPCKVCTHADREAIDAALLKGWPALRAIGAQHGLSKDSLFRHYHAHVRAGEAEARQMAESAESPWAITPERVRQIIDEVRAMLRDGA